MVHIHTEKFRRCVEAVRKSKYDGKRYNPFAVCTVAVKKPFLKRK
jgi:hypothetical protein